MNKDLSKAYSKFTTATEGLDKGATLAILSNEPMSDELLNKHRKEIKEAYDEFKVASEKIMAIRRPSGVGRWSKRART